MTMKESQSRMVYTPANYLGEVNSCNSEAKEACQLNDERNDTFVPFIEFERRHVAKWNTFVTSFPAGIENGRIDCSETKDSSSLFADLNEAKDKSCPENKPGFKETKTEAANDTTDHVNSCSCNSNGTTDGLADDLHVESSSSISKPQDKETDSSSNAGGLSTHVTSLSLEDAVADAHISSQEPNSIPAVSGDVSGDLKKETFLALLSKQENGAAATSETKFSQLASQITGEISLSATAQPMEGEDKENDEGQVPLFHILKKETEKSLIDSGSNPGETSFSAARLISYTGPLPRSGSVSMRSDGSISGRSFAFPILPSEWNSSPVRMAKADRRNYRKHKGWRSGLFCCF